MHFLENNYCQLEHYSFCNLTPRTPYDCQQFSVGDSNKYYAYIERYENIDLVKHRILELDKEWKHGDLYQQNQQKLVVCLFNRWNDCIKIALCNSNEWHISVISSYTLECAIKKKQ